MAVLHLSTAPRAHQAFLSMHMKVMIHCSELNLNRRRHSFCRKLHCNVFVASDTLDLRHRDPAFRVALDFRQGSKHP